MQQENASQAKTNKARCGTITDSHFVAAESFHKALHLFLLARIVRRSLWIVPLKSGSGK